MKFRKNKHESAVDRYIDPNDLVGSRQKIYLRLAEIDSALAECKNAQAALVAMHRDGLLGQTDHENEQRFKLERDILDMRIDQLHKEHDTLFAMIDGLSAKIGHQVLD